jgi:bifunctional DNA-binding transcriptional regulator/antitoxin component of YhaV-PrlF toxin-antitoxin module
MPQLEKGGKYTYGWSVVGSDGRIPLPPEALDEYGFGPGDRLILMPGSKTSGGFSITTKGLLDKSPLSRVLADNPDLAGYGVSPGEPVEYDGRVYTWVELSADNCIKIPLRTLRHYGIDPGDSLLSVRGSRIGIGFAVRGRLVEVAKNHSELPVFK